MSGSGSSAQFETHGRSKNVAGLEITVSRKTSPASKDASSFDHGPETPWRSTGPSWIDYSVTAPKSGSPDKAPGADVTVEKPDTMYTELGELDGYSKAHSADIETYLHRSQIGDGPHGQGALFEVRHTRPYVSHMATHPDMRAHIPTLLSVAGLESQARFREPLKSDRNLSQHSSPIVHRMAQAGLVDAPTDEVRNNMFSEDYQDYSIRTRGNTNFPESEVPHSTVQMGKQFLRDALRGPKQAVERAATVAGAKKSAKQERIF